MYGVINKKQDISGVYYAKLAPNFKFIAFPSGISEESLYILVNTAHNTKNKKKLYDYCKTYKKKEYTKYLDTINKYIHEMQSVKFT